MTMPQFMRTLSNSAPPQVSPALVALWHDARGDWQSAHNVAQDIDDATGSWIHAYFAS
jgi:hypothetical protein